MIYKIEITESANKSLNKLPKKEQQKIEEKIDFLIENPKPDGYKKLQASKNHSLYRIRSGNYRIIYTIKQEVLIILIVEIGHRKDVYKNI
jgi:mRNA interferase RelE/StbE